jgi:signal transduction histidine kinase
MRGRRLQWRQKHSWQDALFDALPAFVLLIVGLADAVFGTLSVSIGTAPSTTAVLPTVVACVALLFRRRRPTTTLVVVVLALVIPPLLTPTSLVYWGEYVPWLVAMYSIARHQRRLLALVGVGVSAAAMAVLALYYPGIRDPADLLYNSVLLSAAWLLGLFAGSWAQYRDRVMRADLERAALEERASRAERARIARELHDVIAHTITVIVMQAGGARLASAADPAIAVTTLAQIEDLGRDSLTELRTLLPLLRDHDDDTPSTPQPTLADVGGLCERMRGLGLPIDLWSDGDTDHVPLGLQLTGYRAVQEGLTNVIKHSGRVRTSVSIRRSNSPAQLTIDVTSCPPVVASTITGSGRGLAGIEERVKLAGGVFRAGIGDDAGFVLHVELPLTRELA